MHDPVLLVWTIHELPLNRQDLLDSKVRYGRTCRDS